MNSSIWYKFRLAVINVSNKLTTGPEGRSCFIPRYKGSSKKRLVFVPRSRQIGTFVHSQRTTKEFSDTYSRLKQV